MRICSETDVQTLANVSNSTCRHFINTCIIFFCQRKYHIINKNIGTCLILDANSLFFTELKKFLIKIAKLVMMLCRCASVYKKDTGGPDLF
jgi:hypothetical protein